MEATAVFCLPFAGAGATFYRGWPPAPRGAVTVVPVQLAGREERFADEPYAGIGAAVDDLAATVATGAGRGRFALFGHSFGAVLAFELARALCAAGGPVPVHLVVSGTADPGTPPGRRSAGLNDDDFVARVEQLAGYVHPALADPDLRDVVLPALRADVALHEAYRSTVDAPLPAPITAFRGSRDHLVTADGARRWAGWTSARFALREFDGGHMYLAENPVAVLAALEEITAADPVRPS